VRYENTAQRRGLRRGGDFVVRGFVPGRGELGVSRRTPTRATVTEAHYVGVSLFLCVSTSVYATPAAAWWSVFRRETINHRFKYFSIVQHPTDVL